MSIEVLPVLYSFRRCPYAMRARWALVVSGVQVELREVLLKDKPAEMLAVSPKATVPVLVQADGGVIDESLDLMLWALRQHDPARWLLPEIDAFDDMLTLIAQCDGEFKLNLDRYKYPERFAGSDAMIHRAAASEFIIALEARLTRHANLFGETMSLADAAIAPFVRQFAQTDSTWFNQQPWQALQRWLQQLTTSSQFESIMVRPRRWRPDHVPVFFPVPAQN
jgi:glutathione S-transferase